MIEAKDTVLSPEERTAILAKLGEEATYRHGLQAITEAQAEETWPIAEKVGMVKVVRWLEKRDCPYYFLDEKVHNFKVVEEEWQYFLKTIGQIPTG